MYKSASSSLWKLSAMTMGIIASAMVLLWFLSSWALRHYFDDVGRAIIEDDLREYGVIYESGGFEAVSQLFNAVGHDEHDQAMRLVTSAGAIFFDKLIEGQSHVRWPEVPSAPSPPQPGTRWYRHQLHHGSILTVGRRQFEDGAEIWFGRTNAADLAAIDRIHHLILIAMALTAVLAIGPVVWFASRVLKPLKNLIFSAHRLASGESLDLRLESSDSIPELQVFAGAFNETLDRVQVLTEELEAANDQLAHELRTPLARIRGNVERILTHPESNVSIRDDAARAVNEIERATSLIQNILSIRAGESGSMKLNLEHLSLIRLVQETYDLYSAAVEEKSLKFSLLVPSTDTPMVIDRQRVQQAVCNLLDNAIAYTPPGGTIDLELTIDTEFATVFMRDSGPGLSESDPRLIWRRFVRGSAASASAPGIGLGLSLVEAVAAAHRGEAGARNKPDGGAEFWIRIPMAQEGAPE